MYNPIKMPVIALTLRAHGMGYAVNVWSITAGWENFPPVISRMISKKPMTVLLKHSSGYIRSESICKDTLHVIKKISKTETV